MHIPNLLALSEILRMYSIGSRNSASVGLYVGASSNPYGLALEGGSRLAGSPLRSTERISRGGAWRALYGNAGVAMLGPAPFIRVADGAFAVAVAGGTPPVEGGTTMTAPDRVV